MSQPLPVHLISGLLGSGKTTCLKYLIQQKPESENWLIVINEFGEIDIDSAQLQTLQQQQIELSSVAGGCICCTAQLGLSKALNQVLQNQQFDRIFIEPTGLGHPAKIIDTLTKTQFPQPLTIKSNVCLVSAQQLTPERWQKSQVMRDLVTLADIVIINKTDQSSKEQVHQALAILESCYPAKNKIYQTRYSQVPLAEIVSVEKNHPLLILSNQKEKFDKTDPHNQLTTNPQYNYDSKLPNTENCFLSHNSKGLLLSAGWLWNANNQFNRVKLKQFFQKLSPYLLRAKGLLKTGNEWQLINWSEQQLEFDDIAWRQDNRLELIFMQDIDIPILFIEEIEQKISACINQ